MNNFKTLGIYTFHNILVATEHLATSIHSTLLLMCILTKNTSYDENINKIKIMCCHDNRYDIDRVFTLSHSLTPQ